ncbi:transmembrane protein 218 [Clupea harengus]|uniref:Transmembrane protein 218 n=1 Tax=Clupea harengus TaxID=7950 RepID=A0A8M1KKM9_CLUHA|nr:transmembrane protein 218 [Clupea harengus]
MTGMFSGVGTGVFLIALVWIVACALTILLSRTTGATKLGIVPVLLLAIIITLILLFFPRASEVPSPVKEVEIVDNFFIGRYVLLSLVSVVFLAVLFMLLPLHLLEPVYAKPLRTH